MISRIHPVDSKKPSYILRYLQDNSHLSGKGSSLKNCDWSYNSSCISKTIYEYTLCFELPGIWLQTHWSNLCSFLRSQAEKNRARLPISSQLLERSLDRLDQERKTSWWSCTFQHHLSHIAHHQLRDMEWLSPQEHYPRILIFKIKSFTKLS